jgi:hypoxanthine-guanine phosphoribosyltransferase
LPATRRAENVRGAFRIRRGCDFSQLRVLVVDDILTTGATCSELAKVLKRRAPRPCTRRLLRGRPGSREYAAWPRRLNSMS